SPNDIIIPVMGITGSGKSSFIARCTGDTSGVGHGLASFTKQVSYGTLKYKGHTMRLVDTPGFDDDKSDDSDILKEIAFWLSIAYSQDPPLLLSGVVYLHPINNVRMKGSDQNNLKMFKALCGKSSLSCVVLATTMWSKTEDIVGNDRQSKLSDSHWKSMVEQGSLVTRHDDTQDSALKIIDHIIAQKSRITLSIQEQLVTEGKSVEDTDAGQELKSKVIEEQKKTNQRLQRTAEDLQEALREHDGRTAEELRERQKKYEAEIEAKNAELENMRIKHEELMAQKKAEWQKADEEREARRLASEKKFAELLAGINEAHKQREELEKSPKPPSYEVAALNAEIEMLKMEAKQRSRDLEAHRFEEQKRLQIEQFENAQKFQLAQSREQQAQALVQREIDKQRYETNLRETRKGANWGAVGAVAGVAAITLCNVM
ncbi:hypothetical protein BS50DRAFT_480247, partial [Corynespora cassiicola Philippines]